MQIFTVATSSVQIYCPPPGQTWPHARMGHRTPALDPPIFIRFRLSPLIWSFIYFTFFIVAYCIYFVQQNRLYLMMASH